MATVLLIRHARSAANAAAVLAGRTPGVDLDQTGRQQAVDLAKRLAELPLAAIVASPLDRCVQTAEPILATRPELSLALEAGLAECDYGEWTGQELRALAKTPLWRAIQTNPSGVRFPGGETMRAMQNRAVEAVRSHDAAVESGHGPDAIWAAVSHADVIKSVVADALGAHLDQFQRIVIDPATVTVLRYTATRPFVLRVNDSGSLADLRPPVRKRGRARGTRLPDSDAVVGGTTG